MFFVLEGKWKFHCSSWITTSRGWGQVMSRNRPEGWRCWASARKWGGSTNRCKATRDMRRPSKNNCRARKEWRVWTRRWMWNKRDRKVLKNIATWWTFEWKICLQSLFLPLLNPEITIRCVQYMHTYHMDVDSSWRWVFCYVSLNWYDVWCLFYKAFIMQSYK